jgi:hypothetical protein
MRKIVIESSHKSTLRLVGTGEGESGNALSPFGPVRAGLITTQRTKEDQVLTELLSSLERKITELNFKSYEALNILMLAMAPLAKHTSSSSETIITDTCDECGNDLPAEGQNKCLECLEKLSSLL